MIEEYLRRAKLGYENTQEALAVWAKETLFLQHRLKQSITKQLLRNANKLIEASERRDSKTKRTRSTAALRLE